VSSNRFRNERILLGVSSTPGFLWPLPEIVHRKTSQFGELVSSPFNRLKDLVPVQGLPILERIKKSKINLAELVVLGLSTCIALELVSVHL
jgi:hypothetical protein